MRLTDKAVKAAQPREKTYRIFDGEGLYLEVRPNGSKYWRMKVTFNGREDRLAFGVYPKVSLANAREERQKALDVLRAGKNPRYATSDGTTFQEVAMQWFNARKEGWSKEYADTVLHRMKTDVFPRTNAMDIARMDAQDVLSIIQPINARGAPVKAKRVLRYINAVFAYAVIAHGVRHNPATNLQVAIKSRPVRHNPHLNEKELPAFLHKLDAYQGMEIVKLATKFLLLTMVRTGEMRLAKWEEFDLAEAMWKIPPERMKMRRPHFVPLSRQTLEILEKAKEYRGSYVFPSPIKHGRPLSDNTVLYALYDMGYKDRLTGHGFRATASTILNERGYNSQAIERQLAHADRNKVRASYNHAEFLSERREILQAWADLLEASQAS